MNSLFGTPGRVVHCRKSPYDIYVGRPSLLGNPYSHIPGAGRYLVKSRKEAIENFRTYARWRMESDRLFRVAIRACLGKTLSCWCAPQDCHAWVILELAETA